MPHAVVVAETRAHFVKVKPVLDALDAALLRTTLVHTGQPDDEAMSGVFFAEIGLRHPDHHLAVGSGSHAVRTAAVMTAFEPLLDTLAPDVVVVIGDVNSTLACSLVAAKAGVRAAHVEAGRRSGDRSMPEEINRIVTDRLCDDLFATSPDAVEHLRREGAPPGAVHLVGNVMVDTLLARREEALARPTLAELGLSPGSYGLVILHRPANIDDPAVLAGLFGALGEIAARCPLVLPAHPRAAARVVGMLPAGVRVLGPVGYLDSLALQAGARIVLTDSGGVQEESTVLGAPCLTLRDSTERLLTVTEGTNRVVGRDRRAVVGAAFDTLEHPPPPRRPALWDGRASRRIARILAGALAARPQPSHRLVGPGGSSDTGGLVGPSGLVAPGGRGGLVADG